MSDYSNAITSSLTSIRIPALQSIQEEVKSSAIAQEDLQQIAIRVLKTFNYYQDVNSRNEALKTLEAFISHDSKYLSVFVKFINVQVTQKNLTMAITDYLTLLNWINKFQVLAQDPTLAETIIRTQAIVLNNCVSQSSDPSEHQKHRFRVHQAVTTSTRTSIVEALGSLPEGSDSSVYYKSILDSSLSSDTVLTYLGVLASALVDLTPTRPALVEQIRAGYKAPVLEYLTNQVLLAKVAPAPHSLEVFGSFVHLHISNEDFASLLPSIEKAILRSSENSFVIILPPFFKHLKQVAGSTLLGSKLLGSVFSAFKSPKEPVRNGAFECLKNIIKPGFELTQQDHFKYIDEVFKALKSTSNSDSKALILSSLSLASSTVDSSLKIINDLLPLIPKDQNETSLASLIESFVVHSFRVLTDAGEVSGDDLKKISVQFNAGLTDKKLPLRRLWFASLGSRLYCLSTSNERISSLVNAVYPSFVKSLEESQLSPVPTVTNKGITNAYVTISLSAKYSQELTVDTKQVFQSSLSPEDEKPSILTDSRVYTKFTLDSEFEWLARALRATVQYSANLEYGLAWIYLLVSTNVPYKYRLQSVELLKEALSEKSQLSEVLINGITKILKEDKVEDLALNLKQLNVILPLMTQLKDQNVVEENLSKLIVISNHEVIPVKNGWVGLVQRSNFNIDVASLLNSRFEVIFKEIFALLASVKYDSALYKAGVKAIGIMAFILPDVVAPKLADNIREDIATTKIKEIDTNSLDIWRGVEGELVINILNQSTGKSQDKNSKDYEIKKWEESVKKELATKSKGPAKKLTKEELVLVNEQIAKESKIRAEVQSAVDALLKAISIINELVNNAVQVDNGSKYWFPVAITQLLEVAKLSSTPELVGSLPVTTFLNLSKLISPKLGHLKEFIGVATIRINSIPGLPENYLDEALLDLTGRILYRVKILSDSQPLDALTLSYTLPLLTKVLEIGKQVAIRNSATKQAVTSEFVQEDPEEEQLLLSIEIISTHSELFEDVSIPRINILEVLISLMKLPSKSKLSKECFLSMCQSLGVTYTPQDLKCLWDAIMTPVQFVRTSILEGIDSEFDLTGEEVKYSNELWIAAHDNDAHSAELATTIWEDNDFEVLEDAPSRLLTLAGNSDSGLRLSIAKSIVDAVNVLGNDSFATTLDKLIDLYHVKKNPPPAVLDRFGLPIQSSASQRDTWEDRSTIAVTLKLLSSHFTSESVEKLFKFLVDESALGDKEDVVRQELLEAGVEVINQHGFDNIETLIPIFEANLGAKDARSKVQDNIKENVIILYGALARHLKSTDPRLNTIIERLIKTLDTPSEDIQYAISEGLAPLVKSFESELQKHFDRLFETLFSLESFAKRRGAAYGIAGLVKGIGIKSLSQNDIVRELMEASDDKKNPKKREGVSFAFECLSQSLGKFFEPYVIEILPIILKFYGDTAAEVREATDSAAKQIMKNTSSYGIKKLIPLTISNLDDEAPWRSKKGSVELLGSMAYLDPTQLSSSLSTIIPEIVGVLNDTHKEVRKAADLALKRFGEVIRNPEIQVIVPDLINAIGDPTKYTDLALDKLIKTQFVHYIDGPSLALIIHVIHRGMKDRSASTKKKACQIVGNMAILVDSKDLMPYLSQLVGELELAMVDPVPATRSTAARALGSLVEKLGEERFPDLIPRLLGTLQDESKVGDRLGSAQALSEVICGLGIGKLEELLPTIISSATSPRNHIRAGFMPLLLFLPVCFGTQFSPYLNRIIPAILNGLADSDEDIRDTSLRAGRLIVKNYAKKAVDLLLPELENGLSDSSYRIRLSSVELTGDLLFQITGISGKNELNEEQFDNSAELNKTLVEILGQDRRDRVLASLFVCRSDVAGIVRSASVDIWKALVANTPKTVKEILPSLTAIIVRRLASNDETHRTIAAQTLGEMVRRVGSNALARLLPTLEESLQSNDNDTRQGICIALNELIKSTSAEGLVQYQDQFISIIRDTLIDSDSKIREAAAQAFESLQEELGKVVIDEILPNLLNLLESSDSQNALLALQEIMASKSDVIFPILIPTLLTPPIDSFKANALSSLASVAGTALFKRLSLIINTLINAIIEAESEESKDDIKAAFDKILLAIDTDDGVHPLMQQLLSLVKHEDSAKRAIVYGRLGNFFANTNLDYSVYLQDMIGQFVLSLSDPSEEVVQGTFEALTALVKRQPKESLEKLVKPTFQALSITGVKGEDLAGFKIARGPNCILPIFLHGLMYGNSDQKETSALGIANIIDKTPALNLKPFATVMTGPLIRVIGEKVLSDIKAAILKALNSLLLKIPQFLRPFIPQLQRTFVRSLSDASNDTLRARAVVALGTLIGFQPRIDSLVTELVTGAKTATDQGVKTSMLKAMLEVVNKAGKNMNETSKTSIMTLVEDEITLVNDSSAVSYARLIGSLANILSGEEAASIIKSKILDKPDNSNDKFCILSINSFLRYSPGHIFHVGLIDEIISFVISCSNSTVPYVSDNATIAIAKILLLVGQNKSPKEEKSESPTPFELNDEQILTLVKQVSLNAIQPASSSLDTRRLALVVIRTVARFQFDKIVKPNFDLLVPSVFACLRDPIIPIKLAAEKAYLSVFNLVDDVEMKEFNGWFEGKENFVTVTGASIVPRSIGDYTKRVASRLAGVERERIEAGGDEETMFSDRFEDEEEVWAVGS
ncbi:ARM repeat-containing protein [Suhomyces tanzawaensis NRRL Y-17324]|uniref:ARM repeat-containing protein n=1 Tax=Suhomyces tanzawaensis NRRL Y-17324 TaxID=984487 RepID=A0A1E4SSK4_9ASCO|nr:ARM repeat-containing protein [Suhomyces tanzawaensis NRRL Y-17324]ODV82484.1 ARM repeat-containing protein [Suhomyces tanzawaensis NRRL Y-17324]